MRGQVTECGQGKAAAECCAGGTIRSGGRAPLNRKVETRCAPLARSHPPPRGWWRTARESLSFFSGRLSTILPRPSSSPTTTAIPETPAPARVSCWGCRAREDHRPAAGRLCRSRLPDLRFRSSGEPCRRRRNRKARFVWWARTQSLAGRRVHRQSKRPARAPRPCPARQDGACGNRSAAAIPSWVQDYALYLLDVEGRIAAWYSGAARIYGYHAG